PSQLFSVPVLWVVARRPAPLTAAMQAALGRLADLGATRLRLAPLAPDATAVLVADRLGAPPDPAFKALLDQAGGNPFYVIELLQAPGDRGGVERQTGASRIIPGALPEAFRSAVAAHTRALPPLAQRLVDVASVFGREVAVVDLAAVMQEPAAHLVGAVADATA